MQKALPSYRLLIIPIASPLLLGVYRDDVLVERVESDEKTSDILLPLIMNLQRRYTFSQIVYTRGPGSYMAIKLTYIILKTIEIVRNIPFVGCSAFLFNGNNPIKAVGQLYFTKEKETIITKKFEQPVAQLFFLPSSLERLEIDEDATPNYILPAV